MLRGEVLGNYRCQERESQFSLRVWLNGLTVLQCMVPTQQHMGNMDGTCWVKIKEGRRLVGREGEWIWKE